jgi:hypothetical protein
VLPDTAVDPASTATASTTAGFDPWDMPYFGGTAYFSYQAALWHLEDPDADNTTAAAVSIAVTGSHPASDAWDAPYFGGTVYLSYSPALPDRPIQSAAAGTGVDLPTPSNPQPAAATVDAETALATNDPARPRKRDWWARLFGRS